MVQRKVSRKAKKVCEFPKKIPFINKIIEVQSKSESLQRKRHVGWNPHNFNAMINNSRCFKLWSSSGIYPWIFFIWLWIFGHFDSIISFYVPLVVSGISKSGFHFMTEQQLIASRQDCQQTEASYQWKNVLRSPVTVIAKHLPTKGTALSH